jgi:hypothetical protein
MLYWDDFDIMPVQVPRELSEIESRTLELLESVEGEFGSTVASEEQVRTACVEGLRRSKF